MIVDLGWIPDQLFPFVSSEVETLIDHARPRISTSLDTNGDRIERPQPVAAPKETAGHGS